jgi:hypothetical protein
VILTVGDATIDPGLSDRHPWLGRLGVELRWVPEPFFREHSYYATGATRFEHEYRSDVVLFLDADILIAAPFDELIRDVYRRQHFAGVMAVASPLLFLERPYTWHELYDHCAIGRDPVLCHEYLGWPYYHTDDPAHRYGPPYFNYGVVCAPAWMMKRIGVLYFPYFLKLRELSPNILITQVALSLALVKLGLRFETLPARYNFPNELALEALHGLELPHAKFLHLWGRVRFNKQYLYEDLDRVRETVLRTDLRGVERMAQRVLTAIEPNLLDERSPDVAA